MNARIRSRVAGLVVIASLAGASIAAVQPDVAIRYKWINGDTLRYRTTQQSTTTMSGLPGMGDMNLEQTMSQVYRTVVQEVAADGTTTLQQILESVKMEMATPMGKMTYDSASGDAGGNPANQTLGSMLSAMIGEPFTVVLLPTGAVQKVEGFSRIFEKMLENLPQDQGGAAIMNAMKGMFNDDAMRNMMAQGFAQFPGRSLKVGESWSSQTAINFPMLGGRTMSIAATLKAVEGTAADQVARIATQLTITQDPAAPALPSPIGAKMEVGDSTGDGEILFDVARGRLLRSTTRMTVPMTMSGPGPDGSPMSMKSTVKSTMTVELLQQ